MSRLKNPYTSEKDLVDHFREAMKPQGFKVYPETSDVDLLLVATQGMKGLQEGDQIAIEAKLTANIKVLVQSMPKHHPKTGPNYHAVLVPQASDDFVKLARRLKIVLFEGMDYDGSKNSFKRLILPKPYRHYYPEPLWVPDIELKTPAGVPSPKAITHFKVEALRLCARIELRGYVTSNDFSQAGVSMSTWYSLRWIKNSGKKEGRYVRYVINDRNPVTPPPHLKYPDLYKQILDDYKKMKISPW